MTTEAARMRDGPSLTDLMTRATGGDKQAWDALVERYIPLVWSICRRHRLDNADARDVSQTVWRQLAGQLGTLRNPAALVGWLATASQQECDRIRAAARRPPAPGRMPEAANIPADHPRIARQELLMAERHAALREAFAHLPAHCRRLIAMLIQDPPAPDAEISAELGIPAPNIRQHCHGCLEKLRRYPAIATLIHAGTSSGSEASGQAVGLF
jgi:RNA polymerase sigma factor (sigma-70 family)